ncbi:ARM repeat-containing protein [Mrakia frigida]|uniref:deoxyhypusine monooxygenase n=1 Tax=Mrakia frigida TaxID=29902 RepID=UPI003FCBFE48
MEVTPAALLKLEECLLNTSGDHPLHNRFRALFTIKAVGGATAIEIVSKGFKDPSPLLKHEMAYVLGQLNDPRAIPMLSEVLEDLEQDPMVRHEAAEALGAISDVAALPILRKYLSDPSVAVAETCEIAIDKVLWDNSKEGKEEAARVIAAGGVGFTSIDPAPGHHSDSSPLADPSRQGPPPSSIASLRTTLLDPSIPLFTRYRAMFSLRNITPATQESIEALAAGFDDKSALFRHEIAYVFGQLNSKYSVPALLKALRDPEEVGMVRHECAEALGGIASEGEDDSVLPILREFAADLSLPDVVRESCVVAVDMWEYETSNQFQYADTLSAEDLAIEEKLKNIGGATGFERSAAI